ncbi:MAG TPA: hypothetical protein VGP64_00585, partial [Polyangia bacterium]
VRWASPLFVHGSECADDGGGVQLVSWVSDTLVEHALLPLPGDPRRAFENGSDLVTVSDSNVRAFSLANLDIAHQTADLVIGTCVPDQSTSTQVVVDEQPRSSPVVLCSLADGRGPGWPAVAAALLGLALGWRRRRGAA